MVGMGMPVGFPKLCFKDGTQVHVNGKLTDDDEQSLVLLERNGCILKQMMPYIREQLESIGVQTGKDNCGASETLTRVGQQLSEWLPYTIGVFLSHEMLDTPEYLFLWKPKDLDCPTGMNLSQKFHQLVPFLPINQFDEIKERSRRVVSHVVPYRQGLVPKVVEVLTTQNLSVYLHNLFYTYLMFYLDDW